MTASFTVARKKRPPSVVEDGQKSSMCSPDNAGSVVACAGDGAAAIATATHDQRSRAAAALRAAAAPHVAAALCPPRHYARRVATCAAALRLLQRLGSQRDGAKHGLVAVAGGRNNVGVDIVQLRRGDVAVVEL